HHVRINSEGWRDRERSPEKPPGIFRIVVLGDSFTWGHGVEDEEIFTRRLEQKLSGVEVLNMGLSGSSTDQQLLILKRDALAFHPDVVIVMICRNDFLANTGTMEGPYGKPAFVLQQDGSLRLTHVPVPDLTTAARAHGWLRRQSALWNLIESTWNQKDDDSSTRTYDRRQASYALMRALLKSMRDEAARGGARLALGIVPSNAHTYFDPVPALEAERVRVIKEIGGSEGIPVLDLVPAFRAGARDPSTGGRIDLHYRADQHWNRRGHELAADEMARLLRQADLIPSHSAP
ncbi:MAG TPA: GDSL-type esterase/lipase family protein, partial [Patescibacteria group bacterium]|nr:GDSL-type esterase/lipase family protein [Patescibacteria group bacterium]